MWTDERKSVMDNLYRYRVNSDGTATIQEYLGNEREVLVPECLEGYPVTVIGKHAFYEKKQLRRTASWKSKVWRFPAAGS